MYCRYTLSCLYAGLYGGRTGTKGSRSVQVQTLGAAWRGTLQDFGSLHSNSCPRVLGPGGCLMHRVLSGSAVHSKGVGQHRSRTQRTDCTELSEPGGTLSTCRHLVTHCGWDEALQSRDSKSRYPGCFCQSRIPGLAVSQSWDFGIAKAR